MATKGLEPINYSYLVVSFIVLILCYYFLRSTQTQLYKKKMNDSVGQRKTIKVTTQKGEIYMDPNIFEMHIKRMKSHITELNKNFSDNECADLKKYLDKTKDNVNSYIKLNTDSIDPDFCSPLNKNVLIDDSILNERELLKANLDTSDNSHKLKHSILDLLIDMDIILFMIRSSLCKNGNLDLSFIDGLILELYRNNCINNKPDFIQKDTIYIPAELPSNTKVFETQPPSKYLDGSQDIMKCHDDLYKNNYTPVEQTTRSEMLHKNSCLSHNTNTDFIDNIKKNNTFCTGLNKRNSEKYKRNQNPEVDKSGRTSLSG
jgi:hypothetical protein